MLVAELIIISCVSYLWGAWVGYKTAKRHFGELSK